jgi:hypothetical protein
MEVIDVPAGVRFAHVWKEPATQGRVCVVTRIRDKPWVTQSLARLPKVLSSRVIPIHSSALYRILRGETKKGRTGDVICVRRASTVDELNSLIASTGCWVLTSDASIWEIEQHEAA